MGKIVTAGELLVEIMRPEADMSLRQPGVFLGPYPSGAPAIFIDTVARLGHQARIIGGVGQDDFGRCLLDRLGRDGVDCSGILASREQTTGVAFVTYFSDGSRQFIYHIGQTAASCLLADEFTQARPADYFHLMGCSLMVSPSFGQQLADLMTLYENSGAKISFDPNIRQELLNPANIALIRERIISHCSVFLPGEDELLLLAGQPDEKSAIAWAFRQPAMAIVVVKRGKRGCTVYTRDDAFDCGIFQVQAVDPTGAGDSFDGAFLCGLLDGCSLHQAAEWASAAAALNTAAFGPMEGDISCATVQAMIESGRRVS